MLHAVNVIKTAARSATEKGRRFPSALIQEARGGFVNDVLPRREQVAARSRVAARLRGRASVETLTRPSVLVATSAARPSGLSMRSGGRACSARLPHPRLRSKIGPSRSHCPWSTYSRL